MKRPLLCLLLISLAIAPSFAQIIYSNDFDGPDPLADMIIIDNDGLTPTVFDYGNAWSVTQNYVTGDMMAVSYSEFFQPGNADDWMITPAIEIPSTGYFVTWENFALSIEIHEDKYELLVSTTGTEIEDFSPIFLDGDIDDTRRDHAVSLDAYAGQSIHLAWRNRSASFIMVLDNIQVVFLESYDIQAVPFQREHLFATGQAFTPSFDFINLGATNITSLDIGFTLDGNTRTETVTGLNIPSLSQGTITLAPEILSEAKQYDFEYTFSNPNGQTDANLSDNSQSGAYYGIANNASKRVVVGEVSQGTEWCDACPEGYVFLRDSIDHNAEDFIGIAVHGGDTLEVFDYIVDIPSFDLYPNVHLNRKRTSVAVAEAKVSIEEVKNTPNPFSLSANIAFNYEMGTITAEVVASSSIAINSDDFRFSMIILEDSLSGNSREWSQSNGFSGGFIGPMGGFENLPNPVPFNQMVYNHVVRDFVGGSKGLPGSIPAVDADVPFSYTFEYDVPKVFDMQQVRVVVLIVDAVTGEIMNATRGEEEITLAENLEASHNLQAKVFPNPANEIVHLALQLDEPSKLSLTISDISGKTHWSNIQQVARGEQLFPIAVNHLPVGLYILQIATDFGLLSQKLSIVR